jgi:hypothetical protein
LWLLVCLLVPLQVLQRTSAPRGTHPNSTSTKVLLLPLPVLQAYLPAPLSPEQRRSKWQLSRDTERVSQQKKITSQSLHWGPCGAAPCGTVTQLRGARIGRAVGLRGQRERAKERFSMCAKYQQRPTNRPTQRHKRPSKSRRDLQPQACLRAVGGFRDYFRDVSAVCRVQRPTNRPTKEQKRPETTGAPHKNMYLSALGEGVRVSLLTYR